MSLPKSFSDYVVSMYEEGNIIIESFCPECGFFGCNLWVLNKTKQSVEELFEQLMKVSLYFAVPSAVSGALGTAGIGATFGSCAGPIGTVAGAIIGGIIGGAAAAIPTVIVMKFSAEALGNLSVKKLFENEEAFLRCQNCGHAHIPD